MKTLRYTITKHHPIYAWKNHTRAVTFELHLEPLIKRFKQSVANHHKYFSNISKTSGRYQEHLDTLLLIEWLEQQRHNNQESIRWDDNHRDFIWCYARNLVYSGQYESVFCSACESTYSPTESSIEDWAVGESLFAEGGKRLLCPNGHVLYAIMDWNS